MPVPRLARAAYRYYVTQLAAQEIALQAAMAHMETSQFVRATVQGHGDVAANKAYLTRPRHITVNPLTGEVRSLPDTRTVPWAPDGKGRFPGETG